jgi:predicted Zn-dependent protease
MRQHSAFATGLSMSLALACAPVAHAFTYDTLIGAVIVQQQSAGMPLTWAQAAVPVQFQLGEAGRVLGNGTTSWDENAAAALAEWTAVVPLLVQQSDAPNVVRWAGAAEDLGGLAANTHKEYAVVNGRHAIIRATTLLNPAMCWDAYEGRLQYGLCHGQQAVILDLRRTVLHELGHVLGLEHPDDGGQMVAAIMNHQEGDTDTLQDDDANGARFLYPPQAVARSQAARVPASGGGHGGGCAIGQGEPDVLLGLVLLALLSHMTIQQSLRRQAR